MTENTQSPAGIDPRPKWRSELDRLGRSVVTGFGIGRLPWAPGTWGSLAAVAVVWVADEIAPNSARVILACVVVLVFFPAVRLAARFERSTAQSDPSEIVIDEILGQVVCLLWVPVSFFSLLAGFIMFRFFDIAKPFPIRRSEKLPGGVGVVLDDIIAGLYAGVGLKAFEFFSP